MKPPTIKKPLQKEILATELEGYAIRLRADLNAGAPYVPECRTTHWVDFEIFQAIAEVTGERACLLYGEDISVATPNLDSATPTVWGFVKWDGCTQLWMAEPIHVDSKDELDRLFAAIQLARAEAGILCMVED